MEQYFDELLEVGDTINKLRLDIYETWFEKDKDKTADELYVLLPGQRVYWNMLSQLIGITEFFGIGVIDRNKKGIEEWLSLIENLPRAFGWTQLDQIFTNLSTVFKNAKSDLNQEIDLLDKDEKDRLNEALNCYVNELNYSAIVMGVSAIESRLYSLMKGKQPAASRLEKMPLGALINEYIEHEEDYEYAIPNKHMPLLEYCNNYRIFSIHPKKEKITRSNATVILCMTCSFLFDKNMKPIL